MRFRRQALLLAIGAMAAFLLQSSRIMAQTLADPVGLSFSTPDIFDPFQVTLSDAGPQSVGLAQLLYPGVELHNEIAGETPGTIRDIDALTLQFYYNGPISVNSTSPAGYDPWDAMFSTMTTDSGVLHTITFSRNPYSETSNTAPINDNFDPGTVFGPQSFANLWIKDNANGDFASYVAANPNAQITITPDQFGQDRSAPSNSVVPETDSLWLMLAGGLPLVGLTRSRFRKKHEVETSV